MKVKLPKLVAALLPKRHHVDVRCTCHKERGPLATTSERHCKVHGIM